MKFSYTLMIILIIFCTGHDAFARHHRHAKHSSHGHHRSHAHSYHQAAVSPSIVGAEALNAELNNIIRTTNTSADIAVYVKSMNNGETLYSRNVNSPLTPASTMKILTAEAALLYLGPEYHFSTQVLSDSKVVENGILKGNLYIVLTGDPTLNYNDLVDLFSSLKAQDIQAIQGNVYIDDTAYDKSFYGPGWIWKDRSNCYAAPIGASIINHNCLPLQVSPAKSAGRAAQVITSPNFFYPAIHNSVITRARGGRDCSLHMSSSVSDSIISLDGCMRKGRFAEGFSYVVADVPDYDRALFKGLLNRMGINVFGNVTFGSAPDSISLVGTHASKPLSILLIEMLKKSDNVIAGALFKKLGQLYTNQPGSWQNGSIAVSQILSQHAGVNISGMRILDGSGLSPDNLTTPSQMMQVLDFAYHHQQTSYEFIAALPIAGVDGTLKHRMGNIARRVRAKTGTISGVVSLAGYAQGADKDTLAFVIMINGSKFMGWRYKEMEDRIATALTRYQDS